MEFITKSAQETKRLGKKIAADLIKDKKKSLTLALSGDLGSGKTTFVQGLAKGLGIEARITSPTFILMRKYEIPVQQVIGSSLKSFYHLDLYRLENDVAKEVRNLGINDIWSDPKNITVIEWAEKIRNLIPKSAIWISFHILGKDKRRVTINKQ